MSQSPGANTPLEPPGHSESLRETIDSIVIALILAFVFRAFIVEAFVIPTGSMASTLNGAHGTLVCRDCGWEFTYGLTDASTRGPEVYDETSVAVCPNCRTANETTDINDKRGNYESGDRILVLKWTYDLGVAMLGPKRWDVVVFKDPSDGVTNYIKRLAGLPDEVLQIIDGDVYTVPLAQLSAEARETLEQDRHVKYLRRTFAELNLRKDNRITLDHLPAEVRDQMSYVALDHLDAELEPKRAALLEELDKKLQVQRKTDDAQHDLWRVVYDHDYPPATHDPGQPQWIAEKGTHWQVNERTLDFTGVGADEQTVELSATIDSLCSYNTLGRISRRYRPADYPVADLRIGFVAEYRAGDGVLSAQLIRRSDRFRTELHADGKVRLMHAGTDGPEAWTEVSSADIGPLTPGRMVDLRMANVDYRVTVTIDGEKVIETSDEQYAPDIRRIRLSRSRPQTLPPAIIARDLDVRLAHVRVDHDVFYISEDNAKAVPFNYHAWGIENYPIMLRGHEFFMLGDNSAQSKDSRLWDEVGDHLLSRGEAYQLGTVPRDQLIGRAFFVYWPSGLRTSLIPALKNVGWIPNFGRMRWIR